MQRGHFCMHVSILFAGKLVILKTNSLAQLSASASFRGNCGHGLRCRHACACRCDGNCNRYVDRQRSLLLSADCKSSPSESEVLCHGRVHWQMRAIGMTSSEPILPLPQEWTDLGDATGSTLTITGDQLPTVDSYVTCEVKASGQCLSSLFHALLLC